MIENVNPALDVSAVEYEREPRYRSGGYSGERRERSGGGDRQFEFGTFSGSRSGGGSSGGGSGGRDRDRRGRGRGRDLSVFTLFSCPSGGPFFFFFRAGETLPGFFGSAGFRFQTPGLSGARGASPLR